MPKALLAVQCPRAAYGPMGKLLLNGQGSTASRAILASTVWCIKGAPCRWAAGQTLQPPAPIAHSAATQEVCHRIILPKTEKKHTWPMGGGAEAAAASADSTSGSQAGTSYGEVSAAARSPSTAACKPAPAAARSAQQHQSGCFSPAQRFAVQNHLCCWTP